MSTPDHHCESYCCLDDCYCCYCYKVSAHYANGGHSFNSPVTVSAADLHTYQLGRSGAGGPNSQQLTSGVMMASPNMTGHVPGEVPEVSNKKREMRLLKNRSESHVCPVLEHHVLTFDLFSFLTPDPVYHCGRDS